MALNDPVGTTVWPLLFKPQHTPEPPDIRIAQVWNPPHEMWEKGPFGVGGVVWTCAVAARGGHLGVLQWARESGCAWNLRIRTCAGAAAGGHLGVLQWARAHDCPLDASAHDVAGQHQHVQAWLEETSGDLSPSDDDNTKMR